MSPADARVAVAVAELRRDWGSVRAHATRATATDPSVGEPQAALVALALDHAYQAFETMLVRVERAIGLPERSGPGGHATLLADASTDVASLRPAVVPRATASDWMELLRFRHFLRHAYDVELDPRELVATAQRLARAVEASDASVRALHDALAATLPT